MRLFFAHVLRTGAAFGLALALAGAVSAQGTIRGVVADSTDGSTLPGANVLVEGTALGAATDIDGVYRIAQVPAGDYTLRVTYVGYEAKRIPVSVSSGRTIEVDVVLSPSGLLGTVVVSGQLEGQAAAINQQLSSNTIVNVVSEEKIQELPDANAAESIGRLPGVSVQRSGGEANQITLRGLSGAFTNVTIDGVKISPSDAESRSVDLSAISQGSLAGIELFKALLPSQDGDAIAGSVNLVTRRAPYRRQLRVDALGGYNDLANSAAQYDVDFRYGERFFGDVLGIQLSGNLERRNRSSEEYDPSFDCSLNEYSVCEIQGLQLDYTDETRERVGAGGIFDLATPDGGYVKLSGIFNQTSRDFVTYGRNYPTDGDLIFYTARDREQSVRLFNGALTGENYLLGLNADWGASYARSESDFPFDYELSFTEPSFAVGGTVIAGMEGVPVDARRDVNHPEGVIPFALNNFDQAYLYSAFFRNEVASDTDLGAYLNLEREYTIGTSVRGALKAGGKYRSKSRLRDRSEVFSPYYNTPFPDFVMLPDGSMRPKDFSGTSFEDYTRNGELVIASNFLGDSRSEGIFADRFTLTPVLSRDLLREWWDLNQHGVREDGALEYRVNREPEVDYYDITERVSAGYVMSTLDLGQFATWIAGVRVEREDNDYASRYAPNGLDGVPVPTGAIRDTSSTYQQTVWLPNTQVALRPTDFLTVRLAAYRALARPDFNNRLANTVARRAGFFFPGNSIVIGNPNLRTATAWNYEAGVSFFGPRLGLLTVSGFYKEIDDYFQLINGLRYRGSAVFDSLGIEYESPFGPDAQFQLRVPYNLDETTTVYGFELEHQTNLSWLRGPLSGVVLGYNFSIVRSSTYVPRVRIDILREEVVIVPGLPPVIIETPITVPYEQEQKLQRQPDFFANVSLGYDFRAFSARLSVFHQDVYTTSFAANPETGADGLRKGYTRVDLAFKQAIGDRIQLLLNVNNLTSVEEGALSNYSFLNRTLVNNSQIYGTTVDLGFRLDL